jgi:hypothetical protein
MSLAWAIVEARLSIVESMKAMTTWNWCLELDVISFSAASRAAWRLCDDDDVDVTEDTYCCISCRDVPYCRLNTVVAVEVYVTIPMCAPFVEIGKAELMVDIRELIFVLVVVHSEEL